MARCAPKGPGPVYGLKTLIGYEDHDPQKTRQPAYTMKFRHQVIEKMLTPGPYTIKDGITNHGKYKAPAQTMVFKPRTKKTGVTPGPGAYSPENYRSPNQLQNAPAYSMVFRHKKSLEAMGPGPTYLLPTCIGPAIPDIPAAGAVCMTFKHQKKMEHLGPGPAAYHTETHVFKKRDPAFSMKFRHNKLERVKGPGPQYLYSVEIYKKREPSYTFGVKYSPCATVGLMENDDC